MNDVVLFETQFFAEGDADLLAHQIDAGHQLRHRVLDLDAGIHFDEVKVVVFIQQKFAGAGASSSRPP